MCCECGACTHPRGQPPKKPRTPHTQHHHHVSLHAPHAPRPGPHEHTLRASFTNYTTYTHTSTHATHLHLSHTSTRVPSDPFCCQHWFHTSSAPPQNSPPCHTLQTPPHAREPHLGLSHTRAHTAEGQGASAAAPVILLVVNTGSTPPHHHKSTHTYATLSTTTCTRPTPRPVSTRAHIAEGQCTVLLPPSSFAVP